MGEILITYSMGIAKMHPSKMPPRRTGLTKAPILPLSLSLTHIGALMQQRDVSQPLLKARSDMFTILNQSEVNSQVGPTSKAVSRKVSRKMILA